MKVITETKTITQEVETYVASDNQKFNTEHACLKHEKELKRKELYDKIQLIEHKNDIIPMDGEYHGDDMSFVWYCPKTDEETDEINEYHGTDFRYTRKGSWIYVEAYDLNIPDSYTGTLDNCICDIKDFMRKFDIKEIKL